MAKVRVFGPPECCRRLVQYVTLDLRGRKALPARPPPPTHPMEATLHALGQIVLRGLPTFFLLILLHFYMKRTFFAPLEKVLAERYAATTGARKEAEVAMARAEAKAKEYEDAIRAARTEVYRENDALRKAWRDEQAVSLAGARAKADSAIAAAKEGLAAEARIARETLQSESDRIAESIAAAVLGRAA